MLGSAPPASQEQLRQRLHDLSGKSPGRGRGAMKHLRALLMFILLATSRRYRRRWRRTMGRIDAVNDEVERSMRRIEAMEQGGSPEVRSPDRTPPP